MLVVCSENVVEFSFIFRSLFALKPPFKKMSFRPRGPWSTNTHPKTATSFHVRGELYLEFLLRTRHMAIYITRKIMGIKRERFSLLFFLYTIAVHFRSYIYIYLDLIPSHQESDVWSEYYSYSVHFRTSSGVSASCQTREEKGGVPGKPLSRLQNFSRVWDIS